MTFQAWVVAVQNIARRRGLILTTTYQSATWVSFNWRAANNTRFGSGGAGAEFIGLTTPEEYTWDWYGLPTADSPRTPPPPPLDPVPALPWERHGRFVPRVPAIAVAAALQALFKGK